MNFFTRERIVGQIQLDIRFMVQRNNEQIWKSIERRYSREVMLLVSNSLKFPVYDQVWQQVGINSFRTPLTAK